MLADMDTGDFLLLLESTAFRYVGQVIHRVTQPCWDLSEHIWGEQRFPLIILLQGQLIDYGWDDFRNSFGFDPVYHMRGNTMRLASERIASSAYETEERFIASLLTEAGAVTHDQERDFRAIASNLEVHFRLVKARDAQQKFRRHVLERQGQQCTLCGIDYPEVLEAAHIVPKEHDGTDDPRNGLGLCVLHHRMFDAGMFAIHPTSLAVQATPPHELSDLRISRSDLKYLLGTVHRDALSWRWQHQGGDSPQLIDLL